MQELRPVFVFHPLNGLCKITDPVFQMVRQQHHVAPEGAVQTATSEHPSETVHCTLYADPEDWTDEILVRYFKKIECREIL